jgi:hypothetical protein
LGEKPADIAAHFSAGAALTFGALLAEGFVFGLVRPSVPAEYHLVVETFIFIALIEETMKIAQIVQLAERRNVQLLRETIAIALVVAAGFAGAENIVYLFRYADNIPNLLLIRTFTAVPLHLAQRSFRHNSFLWPGKIVSNLTITPSLYWSRPGYMASMITLLWNRGDAPSHFSSL